MVVGKGREARWRGGKTGGEGGRSGMMRQVSAIRPGERSRGGKGSVRLATGDNVRAGLDGRGSSRVGLGVPNSQGGKESEADGGGRGPKGAEVPERRDGVGGGKEAGDRSNSGGDSQ